MRLTRAETWGRLLPGLEGMSGVMPAYWRGDKGVGWGFDALSDKDVSQCL